MSERGQKNRLFWFFALGLWVGKNQMCLFARWLLQHVAQRLVYEALGISKHFTVKPLQSLLNVTPLKLALSAQ
jgi:hypothetical protein